MSEPTRKVQPGDALVIPAATYNGFIDCLVDLRQRQSSVGQSVKGAALPTGAVLIVNESGGNRNRFDVLGVAGPFVLPDDDAQGFRNRVALRCVTPTADHAGRFVVLLEPVADGAVGRAMAAGVTVAVVDITGTDATHVDAAADTYTLADQEGGSARILWREGGTGEQWAVVRLGDATGGSALPAPSAEYQVLQAAGDPLAFAVQHLRLRVLDADPTSPANGEVWVRR